jgi:excisionase family DNA binding protein
MLDSALGHVSGRWWAMLNGGSTDNRLTPTWGLKEAAAYLHVHPDTCRKLAKERTIPATKIGRAWIFMPHLLAEYVEAQCLSKVEKPKGLESGGSALAAHLARHLETLRMERMRERSLTDESRTRQPKSRNAKPRFRGAS